MSNLTHLNEHGQAHMVDIGDKDITHRQAIATGTIHMSENAFYHLEHQQLNKKGEVLSVARIAAIQGAKQTSNIIPLCHLVPITHIEVEFFHDKENNSLTIKVTTESVGKTGVEMEALNAVSIGLLTVYDMLKAVDKNMRIENIHLLKKKGGKSELWEKIQ